MKQALDILQHDAEGSYAKCVYHGAKDSVAGLENYVVERFDKG